MEVKPPPMQSQYKDKSMVFYECLEIPIVLQYGVCLLPSGKLEGQLLPTADLTPPHFKFYHCHAAQ